MESSTVIIVKPLLSNHMPKVFEKVVVIKAGRL